MRWYEHHKNEARGFKLRPPYDRIVVGCDPRDGMTKETADSFDVFMNVSDTACTTFEPSRPGQHMHWYPVNEAGRWNLSYMFWLKTVLDHHYALGHRIYLHCHAGAYRSPSAATLWLLSRGHSPRQALKLCKDKGPGAYRLWRSLDNIPKETERVFRLMNEHPGWSLGGILLHDVGRRSWNHEIIAGHSRTVSLLHHYFWFWYEPKWWLHRQKQDFEYWAVKRYGWYSEGCGTYYYPRKYFWAWGQNAEHRDDDYDFQLTCWDPKNGRDPYDAV